MTKVDTIVADSASHMSAPAGSWCPGPKNWMVTLTPAANALEANHPLAATLMRRAMIEYTLGGAKSKRYRHAARHLAECRFCDPAIEDYGNVLPHGQFVEGLREKHGRKYGFWHLIDE